MQTGERVSAASRTVGSSAGGVVVQRNHDASGENSLRCAWWSRSSGVESPLRQLTCQRRCRDRSGTACGQCDERERGAPSVENRGVDGSVLSLSAEQGEIGGKLPPGDPTKMATYSPGVKLTPGLEVDVVELTPGGSVTVDVFHRSSPELLEPARHVHQPCRARLGSDHLCAARDRRRGLA